MTSRLVAAKCASPVPRHASRIASGSSVPSARGSSARNEAPTTTAWPPASQSAWCDPAAAMIWPPRGTWASTLTRLPIVPLATKRAASLPSSSAARSWRALTVGSSPKTSSPSSASAIARRMAGLGRVTVSDRRSMLPSDIPTIVPCPSEGSADPQAGLKGDGSRAHLLPSAFAARTRGVAAQHASLSRWRSPVRIRSGPPGPRSARTRPLGATMHPFGDGMAQSAA